MNNPIFPRAVVIKNVVSCFCHRPT